MCGWIRLRLILPPDSAVILIHRNHWIISTVLVWHWQELILIGINPPCLIEYYIQPAPMMDEKVIVDDNGMWLQEHGRRPADAYFKLWSTFFFFHKSKAFFYPDNSYTNILFILLSLLSNLSFKQEKKIHIIKTCSAQFSWLFKA